MMMPFVLDSVRTASNRSLWTRRHRSIVGFLVGYLSVWTLAGAAAAVLTATIGVGRTVPFGVAGGLGFGLAAWWQGAPRRRRALRLCHRTIPLAPRGWKADRDCLRFGWLIGSHCLVSCWALMLACALTGHALPAMVGCSVIGAAERFAARPDTRLLVSSILGLSLLCFASQFFPAG